MMEYSIIIPVYNTESDKLRKCIDSVIKYNDTNYEIIIIDDGSSSPDTLEQLEAISHESSVIVKKINNSGSAVARNHGLDIAKGKYIIFLDSDDCIDEMFWISSKKVFDEETEIYLFDYCYGDNKSNVCGIDKSVDLLKKNDIYSNILLNANFFPNYLMGSIWGKCFLKSFLDKHNIRFKPEIRKAQDRMFMLEAFYWSEHILYVPIKEYEYSINENSITHKFNMKIIDYYYSLYVNVENFVHKNNIAKECMRLFVYGIINEALPLTVFNENNTSSYKRKKKVLEEIYEMFNYDEKLKNINLRDMYSQKSRIKLVLFKFHLFRLLNIVYSVQR